MKSAVEARGLCKSFADVCAVDHLDLSIGEGETFGLLGVNGAGKTTTIRMLCGLSVPTAGKITLGGFDLKTQPAEAKSILGISPQETAVAPALTVRENLRLLAEIYGMAPAEADARAEEVIGACGLSEVAGRRAKLLSGGWQRRLSIAMATVHRPRVLFLDEPTLGLDVLARRALWEQIRAMKNGGVTILLTTHYLEEAEALCDRIAVMVKGKTRACGRVEDLCRETGTTNLEDAFVALAKEAEAE